MKIRFVLVLVLLLASMFVIGGEPSADQTKAATIAGDPSKVDALHPAVHSQIVNVNGRKKTVAMTAYTASTKEVWAIGLGTESLGLKVKGFDAVVSKDGRSGFATTKEVEVWLLIWDANSMSFSDPIRHIGANGKKEADGTYRYGGPGKPCILVITGLIKK